LDTLPSKATAFYAFVHIAFEAEPDGACSWDISCYLMSTDIFACWPRLMVWPPEMRAAVDRAKRAVNFMTALFFLILIFNY
jgi:hypothetical protein